MGAYFRHLWEGGYSSGANRVGAYFRHLWEGRYSSGANRVGTYFRHLSGKGEYGRGHVGVGLIEWG